MGSARNFFLKIDQFIFNKIDQLKNDSGLLKLNDLLLNLTDDQQRIFIQVLVFSFILIPYFFLGIFWWSNHNIKTRLDFKTQIIDQIALLNGNRDTLSNVTNNFLSSNGINSRDEIEGKIINIASRYNINSNKVRLLDFNPISTSTTITKTEAKIKFTDFGTQDFSNFMRELVEIEKFKIYKVDLNKNIDNSLLEGTLEIRHMGRTGLYQ
jgi:hypothetical protein